MPMSQTIFIALCFNNDGQALVLSEKLGDMFPNITFVTASSFDGFLKAIAAVEKIDCLIVEENYKECSAYDLIENFKQSNRYKKTLRVLFLDNLENIKSNFIELNNHYNFDLNTNISEVKENLRMHISKKLTPVIPKNFNVLVLDNSPEMLEIISIHLNDLGHSKFDLCHSILESKEKLSKKEYDLLLLDWNLDDGTCIDLIEFIHDETQSERTRSAVVVVITGRDDVDDIMTLLRYGVKNHIIKPFGFNEFEEKVSYAIEIHMRKNI